MRVGLDITQAVKRRGRGIARYIRAVLPEMMSLAGCQEENFEAVPYVRGERVMRRAQLAKIVPSSAVRWLPLSWILLASDLELFHSFGNHLPANSRVPLTITVHDLRALELESGQARVNSRLHRNIARSAGVLCLTEYGRSRLLRYFPEYDPDCLVVVPHGVDHERFKPQVPERARDVAGRVGLRTPFLLQLGSWFPHKNLELAINSFSVSRARKAGHRLAFVGGGATREYRSALDDLAFSKGVSDLIDWVDDIPGADIPALISAASCLLQPSYYEGFSLPVLESMAVGTPGVVSDSSCLPEVSGGAWPITQQDDIEAFAAAIDEMSLESGPRASAIEAGLKRAAAFTWKRTARGTLQFFRTVAAKSSA